MRRERAVGAAGWTVGLLAVFVGVPPMLVVVGILVGVIGLVRARVI